MAILDLLAEQKIIEAIARGELANLPGEGRPLDLGDDALVPEDLRMAWRILKNAGFVPPEVDALREIGELERYIETLCEGEMRNTARRKLQLLCLRLEGSGLSRHGLRCAGGYAQNILERLSQGRATGSSSNV